MSISSDDLDAPMTTPGAPAFPPPSLPPTMPPPILAMPDLSQLMQVLIQLVQTQNQIGQSVQHLQQQQQQAHQAQAGAAAGVDPPGLGRTPQRKLDEKYFRRCTVFANKVGHWKGYPACQGPPSAFFFMCSECGAICLSPIVSTLLITMPK